MPSTIAVIGTGYVGLVSGTCFAENGNRVHCVDNDPRKLEKLQNGKIPIYEPGLLPLYERNFKEKRLTFTDNLEEAVLASEVIFLCLPTPPNEDGSADLQYVLKVADEIGIILRAHAPQPFKIVVDKSTVPIGTSERVTEAIRKHYDGEFTVASNPEFLREGFAVEDSLRPDRVVIGTSHEVAKKRLTALYEPFMLSGNPIIVMDERSAEITKYAANSFLAMRISFMNDLANLCEILDANVDNIRKGIGSDTRIGKKFLFSGVGYGGSCFPKDVKALLKSSNTAGHPLRIVQAVEDVNADQPKRFFEKIRTYFGGESFPYFDTQIGPGNLATFLGSPPRFDEGTYDTLNGADALLLLTEWNEFRQPDWGDVKARLTQAVIFDGRNIYDSERMEAEGFDYFSIGRAPVLAKR